MPGEFLEIGIIDHSRRNDLNAVFGCGKQSHYLVEEDGDAGAVKGNDSWYFHFHHQTDCLVIDQALN